MKKILVPAFAAMFLLPTLAMAQAPAAAPAAAPAPAAVKAPAPVKANKPGIEVPAWEAELFDGGKTSSQQLKGKPYAIIFVNSSCSACRSEMNDLGKRAADPDKFAVFIGAVDAKPERIDQTYRENYGANFPIIKDTKFQLAKKFGIAFTPATVVVDKDGKVEGWFAGYADETQGQVADALAKYGFKEKK